AASAASISGVRAEYIAATPFDARGADELRFAFRAMESAPSPFFDRPWAFVVRLMDHSGAIRELKSSPSYVFSSGAYFDGVDWTDVEVPLIGGEGWESDQA